MHSFYKGVLLGAVVSVVVLMAGTALAGSGVGGVFNLGKVNKVNRTSYLSGAAKGKLLQLTNKGSGAALALKVRSGKAPLTVNSTKRVKRLNADLLDGLHASALRKVYTARRDLDPGSTYEEMLTLPGFVTVSVLNTIGGRFNLSVRRVNTDESIRFAHPDGSVGMPASGFGLLSQSISPNTAREFRYLVWNSTRAADLRFNVMRVSDSDQLTVFVEATVQ
jgi:hypothetical protein